MPLIKYELYGSENIIYALVTRIEFRLSLVPTNYRVYILPRTRMPNYASFLRSVCTGGSLP